MFQRIETNVEMRNEAIKDMEQMAPEQEQFIQLWEEVSNYICIL